MKPQLFRQGLILTGLFLCSISEGYIFGQMSGMVAAMETDEDLNLNKDQISWIASMINVTCVCGFAVAGVVTEVLGRRRTISVLTAPIIANWVLIYYATDYYAFLLSRVIVGVSYGGVLLLVLICTCEYTAPNIRGFYLNMMTTVGTSLGTTIGHILSALIHWRSAALVGLGLSIVSALLPWFWVESPAWLASKGKFKECENAFKALHSHRGKESDNELNHLIELEKYKNDKISKNPQTLCHSYKIMKKALCQRYFWWLSFLMGFINVYRIAAGKIQYSILAINMLQDITGHTDVLLYTALVDLFFVAGSLLSCFLILKMKMLTLLFSTAIVANVILLLLSACIYFQPADSLLFSWINSGLLALYLVSINSGPFPVLEGMFCEIMPLEIRGFSSFIFGAFTGSALVVSIKLAGPLYNEMGYYGVFLLNVALMSISLIYFCFKLPETKGRTLQEVEMFIKTGKFENITKLIDDEQMKALSC